MAGGCGMWATLLMACASAIGGSCAPVSVQSSAELAAALRQPGVDTVALRGRHSAHTGSQKGPRRAYIVRPRRAIGVQLLRGRPAITLDDRIPLAASECRACWQR